MKKIIHISIAIALLTFNYGFSQTKRVKGNGNITTKTHSTEDYSKVNVVGFMDVTLVHGTEGSITVTTDENIQEYIKIISEKGKLTIKVKNNISISTKNGVHITVPFTDISGVQLTGSGDVATKNVIKSNTFETELTGSGDMVLEIDIATTVDAKITGSGDLKLTGKATDLEIKVTGSGDFVGKDLKAQNVQAYVSGSGDASVNASKSIKARVNGSGDVDYYGNPEVTSTKVLGSGDISSH